MLSRYKQAYNILTHSKAFAEDGSFDNSKVNKDRFTPHNLRTLIICSNRLFLINYVTGGVFGSIVEERSCNSPIAVNGFKEHKDYEQWFQKEPGVIDALGIKKDGKLLTFNCLESIVLVDDGGWNQQEMNKEYHRITQFVNNMTISKTMNRLSEVLFVKGVNPDGFRGLKSDIPASKFLKDKGIQYQVIGKFEITKTEEGLLPSPKLDSGNYAMDSKYDPQNPSDNQNCRLSKYFYEARQKEIRYLEKKKAENQRRLEEQKKAEEQRKLEEKRKLEEQKKVELQKKTTDDKTNNTPELSYNERAAILRRKLAGPMGIFRKHMLDILEGLYKTGFTGFPQDGIMAKFVKNVDTDDSPIVYINYQENKVVSKKEDDNTFFDNSIYSNICGKYPMYQNIYVNDNEFIPSINELIEKMNSKEPYMLMDFHLTLQSANIRYAKGLLSISRWVKETKKMEINEWKNKCNNNCESLQAWKDVLAWYGWVLDNVFIDAAIRYNEEKEGYRLESLAGEELNKACGEIVSALYYNLKNVIVVNDRDNKELSSIEIRLGSNNTINKEVIMSGLANSVNIGGSGDAEIESTETNSESVIGIKIIYDKAKADKSILFAGDVIDKFIDSGNIPSWSHALIGRKDNGELLFWDDFMNPAKAEPYKRCYTIYAGSRSGKGVMTSTLVASALCDSKQVFYTDGKPENGATLGMVAWNEGKEAYVFDGKPSGELPFNGYMEEYTNGVRNVGEVSKFLTELPSCLFENPNVFSEADHMKYLGLMRYLKSLMLCSNIILGRSQGSLDKKEWQVWIFDEMTKMSNNEQEIRACFYKYLLEVGIKVPGECLATASSGSSFLKKLQLKNRDIINPESDSFDEGVKYIYDWFEWTSALISNVSAAAVINLGKADANLIFIFQEATWIKGANTTIGTIVESLKSTKIVGNKGIAQDCGEYGAATLNKVDWKIKVDSGTGYWAMSSSSDIRTSEVTVFKPFSIWTIPMKDGKINPNPISDAEKTRYFAGYARKLLSSFGLNPADVIQSAYNYADYAVKELGLLLGEGRETVKDYIYDCVNLTADASLSLAETQRKMMNGDVNSSSNEDSKPHMYREIKQDNGYNEDDEIDMFEDNTSSTPYQRQQPQSQPFNQGSRQPQQPQQRPIRPQRPQQNNQDLPDNKEWIDEVGYSVDSKGNITGEMDVYKPKEYQFDEYNGRLTIEDNPFERYDANSKIGGMLCVKELTYIIRKDIETAICPTHMVKSVIIKDNKIAINDILYTPQFDDRFIQSLPMAIRNKVQNGEIVELLDMRMLYRYHNLEHLVVEDKSLAQGRARKEMGIGFRKRWSVLFEKFDNLYHLTMGDAHYFRDNPDNNDEDEILENFKKNPSSTYSTAAEIGSGLMNRVWDSKPCRILTKAAGWTVGVQAVWFMASLCGPWGLLFGAFAAYNTMKEINKDRPQRPTYNNQQYQGGYQSKPQQPQGQQPKKKSTNNQGNSTNKKKPQNNSNNSGNSGDAPWYGDTKWNY